ncbi:LysM peptidoglycan-binding domain-containing protein [Peribacillus castrilensis]|uniref:NLP/P60 protein n=1 Tax=Peribacillus simplex TaxID=1478 RepID=A0AAN2PEB1_9BACI|nr:MULTISPECIES: peptidoglycan endopeptidase [Bacillaceae]MCF7621062.1 LysM peptidoglycan-binding domain-containing protein [Peribacillus frigoritolerans]MCT1386876.1 LysM peptidoglycan-binding domain-containing protein [Peribacillus frigoritolerans]PRA94162.1 peptidoglycan endopeptidase [Peribacillus simplex]CEG31012.1 NLP/P60 protein [Peribacillus simplex]
MNNSKNSFILAGTIIGTLIAGTSAYAGSYQVKSGDTLDKISKANNTTVQHLKSQNHLTSNLIFPGQVLKFNTLNNRTDKSKDKTEKYVVKLGDSLSKIANKYNVSVSALLKLNPNISNSDRIYIGQTIRVSGQASGSSSTAKNSSNATYKVKSGDTLGKIARVNNMTVQQLKSINHLTSTLIFPGQVLKVNAITSNPDKSKNTTDVYVVKLGDSLSTIAKRYNLSLSALLKINPNISNSDRIRIGQTIRVSGKASASASASASNKPSKSTKVDQVLAAGAKYMGAKYVYGASTSRTDVFDCSSFTLRAFQSAGISLPRNSVAQSHVGTAVSSKALQKGDLVFFDTNNDGVINHVGIYAGNGQMLNASTSKGVSYANINNSYWGPSFVKAVRVLN